MIAKELPKELRYEKIIPRGFPSALKKWELEPTSTNQSWTNSGAITRFNFMGTKTGVLDPARSCIEIIVSVAQEDNPMGLLQVDNSAQSFINQLVLYSNSTEIERIQEYGVLATYLNDIGLSEHLSEGRETEGLGYSSFDTMPYSKQNLSNACQRQTSVTTSTNSFGQGLLNPTQQGDFLSDSPNDNIYAAFKTVRGHITQTNPLLNSSQITSGGTSKRIYTTCYEETGYFGNMRAEYVATFQKNNFIESPESIPCSALALDRNVFIEGGFVNSDTTNPVFPQNDGSIMYSTTPRSEFTQYDVNHEISAANTGYSNLFSPAYTRGTFEPFISRTVRQGMCYQGKILRTKEVLYRRKFKIPILSSIIGALIDPEQYMLIPLRALDGLMMEITFDKYAMFTSGWKDICEFDLEGMTKQQERNWQIERIQYVAHTYHFIHNEVNQYIESSMYQEINFVSSMWYLGNQFQIPAGQGPGNTYFVTTTAENLSQVVCLFIANDHMNYSFCRKNFRLSNNITKFQAKMGMDYWPPQPYKGNGGNPYSNEVDFDNSEFLENIYFSAGLMFAKVPLPRINCYNFALNERVYNPANRNTYYNTEMKFEMTYPFTTSSINGDTALGMPYIHENRAVGKAAYVLSFSPHYEGTNVMRGVDVSGSSNFEILFESDPTNAFPREQTLMIFARVSVNVVLGINGISVHGK